MRAEAMRRVYGPRPVGHAAKLTLDTSGLVILSNCRFSLERLPLYGADASIMDVMREQIGSCPHRNDAQIYTRCNPYSPTLAQLFGIPDQG